MKNIVVTYFNRKLLLLISQVIKEQRILILLLSNYIKDNHETIVPREIWDKAQEIRQGRLRAHTKGSLNVQRYLNRYPYSGLLMCGECGGPFKRRYWNYGYDCQDEHTIVYLIPKNRPHLNEEIKQFRYRYMNSKVILSGHKESKRNKKFYYIDYKVVLV